MSGNRQTNQPQPQKISPLFATGKQTLNQSSRCSRIPKRNGECLRAHNQRKDDETELGEGGGFIHLQWLAPKVRPYFALAHVRISAFLPPPPPPERVRNTSSLSGTKQPPPPLPVQSLTFLESFQKLPQRNPNSSPELFCNPEVLCVSETFFGPAARCKRPINNALK